MRARYILRFVLALFFSVPLAAQTINAASCSASDVQSAFSLIVNTTRTVNIPAGTCHWTTPVTLNVPSGNTSLSILGAGNLSTTGGGDSTVIIDDYSGSGNVLLINQNLTASGLVRLAGITIQAGSGPPQGVGSGAQMVGVNGAERFRLDHSHINVSAGSGITGVRLNGCIYGVADRNIVDGTANTNGIQEYNQGSCYGDSLGVGDQAWAHATGFGSLNNFTLENNIFNDAYANDCTLAGAFVMRFNTFNETTNTASAIQTHPTGGAGRWRGCRMSEIYMNTLNISSFMNAAIFFSSGPAMIWGNSAASSSCGPGCGLGAKQFIQLESIRVDNTTYSQLAPPKGWGYCSSAFTGTASNWDGNLPNATVGYPCIDQPGRGIGDFLTGGFSFDGSGSDNVTNSATGCTWSSPCAYPRQALDPVYIWGSGWLSTGWQPVPSNTSHFAAVGVGSTVLTQNVDYYTGIDDNGNPISFNCTVGIGAGTFANRPAGPCTNGVAYWAIDQGTWNQSGSGGQGVLYIYNNGWPVSPSYTPGTYPHPLTGSQTSYTLNIPLFLNGTLTGPNCVAGTNTYPAGTVIGPCTAVPIAIAAFSNWTSVTGSATCSGSTNPCPAFTLSANSSFLPVFSLVQYAFTLSVLNGSVSGTNCATGLYFQTTTIGPCTASCSGSLTNWSATGSAASCNASSTNPCASFSLTSNSTLQANCTAGSQPHLSGFILTGGKKNERKNRTSSHPLLWSARRHYVFKRSGSNAAIRTASSKRHGCVADNSGRGELVRCGGDHGDGDGSAYNR